MSGLSAGGAEHGAPSTAAAGHIHELEAGRDRDAGVGNDNNINMSNLGQLLAIRGAQVLAAKLTLARRDSLNH
jgi:hypothetical protein